MIYVMRCTSCGDTLEMTVPANKHTDLIKPGWPHPGCLGRMEQVILAPHTIINRSPFPGRGNEVQLPTDHGEDKNFRDKSEARDWLSERGLTSKWIENDM